MELLPGIILSFRETLEACLILIILIQLLRRKKEDRLLPALWSGAAAGILLSLVVAYLLTSLPALAGNGASAKLWESLASFGAVLLVTPLILWMIRHGSDMNTHIKDVSEKQMSRVGLFIIASLLIAREGVEIVIFSIAGDYSLTSILLGMLAGLLLVGGVYFAFFRIRFDRILQVSLFYIILQAGYLFGYGIHELISSLPWLAEQNFFSAKAFDLSGTVLNHKDGLLGLPLHILLGWYSKPEWISLLAHYGLAGGLLTYWYTQKKRRRKNSVPAA